MFVIRFVSVVVACTLHRRDTRVPVDGEALKLRDAGVYVQLYTSQRRSVRCFHDRGDQVCYIGDRGFDCYSRSELSRSIPRE